jgi:hypothetical protein
MLFNTRKKRVLKKTIFFPVLPTAGLLPPYPIPTAA